MWLAYRFTTIFLKNETVFLHVLARPGHPQGNNLYISDGVEAFTLLVIFLLYYYIILFYRSVGVMYLILCIMTRDMSFIIVMIYRIQINTIQYNTIQYNYNKIFTEMNNFLYTGIVNILSWWCVTMIRNKRLLYIPVCINSYTLRIAWIVQNM